MVPEEFVNVIYQQVARFYSLSCGYLVGNMPQCTWYAHGMHMVCTCHICNGYTLPESAFQSSNLIGLVRGVVRATMHIHIYNVVAYIHVCII